MPRGQNWKPEKVARLIHMRADLGMPWADIGAAMGEKPANCCTRYNYHQAKKRIADIRARVRAEVAEGSCRASATAPQQTAQSPAHFAVAPSVVPPEPSKRPRYFHHPDADIRGRIARQGITAGLFGDPPPGRSALDQREARK